MRGRDSSEVAARLTAAARRAENLSRAVEWGDYPLTAEAKGRLRDLLDARPRSAGGPPHGELRSRYDDVMDEVRRKADARGVSLSEVGKALGAISESGGPLTSQEELIERTGMGYHTARRAAAVLSDMGDLHECYDDDWNLWWVRCDEFIREKCDERRISLYRYFEMYEELHEFQNKVIAWYVRRNRRQDQPFNLRDLKEEYVHRLQEEYFPDKPVHDPVDSEDDVEDESEIKYSSELGYYTEGEWSRHIAARYLRTAQDVIVRSYDLTY